MNCEYCNISDSETKIIKSKFGILCRKHYLQMYKFGKIKRTIYDRNDIIYHGNYAEIVLRDKNAEICGYAEIDIEDIDKVKNLKWHIKNSRNTQYAVHNDHGHARFMHEVILEYDGDKEIDHIDHNGLNNRKSNLRIVTHSQNIMNQHNETNGVKQVPSGRYQAHITVNGKSVYLGTYDTFKEAKEARTNYEASLF